MNVSIQNTIGLKVYKELIEKETSGPARWEANYGLEAQLKGKVDPAKHARSRSKPGPSGVPDSRRHLPSHAGLSARRLRFAPGSW